MPSQGKWGYRAMGMLLIFAPLQLSWQWLQGSAVQWAIVHDGTVRPAAQLANWITPGIGASAVRFTLHAPGGSLNILNGCEGVEAVFLLAAAFAVAPLSLRSRMLGFISGTAFVFVVNEVRILALFYASRSDHALFDLLHGTVTPVAVILLVCGYFYAWLRSAPHAPVVAQ